MKPEIKAVCWVSVMLLMFFGTTYLIMPDFIWRRGPKIELHVLVWWSLALVIGGIVRSCQNWRR